MDDLFNDGINNTENTEGENSSNNVSKKISSRIPRTDANLLGLAKTVLKTWEKTPEISLIWMSFADFTQKVSEYEGLINQKSTKRTQRSPISYELKKLDKLIDEKISFVKNAIKNHYGTKDPSSYYSTFGIVKVSRGYIIPKDRQKRILSLKKMLEGVTEINLESDQFGIAFWTDIYTKYENLLNQTTDNVQDFSQFKSEKEVVKEKIILTLKSLIYLIRANYPDTQIAQLRVWGFLRELF